jgi:plastocyanin
MLSIKYIAALATVLLIAGCASVPETTRTGAIHEARFEEHLTPTSLVAQVGDEIRWVNRRSGPVTLEFLGDALDDIVCQKGFTSIFRRRQESISIAPNETASLCFGRVGVVTYNARMESAVAGGQTIESGTIRIR